MEMKINRNRNRENRCGVRSIRPIMYSISSSKIIYNSSSKNLSSRNTMNFSLRLLKSLNFLIINLL